MSHPLLDRLLRRFGASPDVAPSLEIWQRLLERVAQTYRDADQDRYTIERSMDISSQEMQTLHHRLQQTSAREIARHRMLFENSPLPMWVFDGETLRILDANAAMEKVYGYARDELLALRMVDLERDADAPTMIADITGVPIDGTHDVGIRRHFAKDGRIILVDITAHKLVVDGRTSLVVIATDRTRSARVEEELRQAQKMDAIGRLAGGIAHDFNNLLGVILGNSELALDALGDGHPAAEDLAEISAAATRAAGLTRQLLTFSRKQARQPKPLALNAVVTGIEAMLARIVGEDIAMSAVIAPGLGTIAADPGEVEQVVMNLVVNARDAMPAGGQLMLRTSNETVDAARAAELGVPPGAYVVLAVTDTGCGMTADIRARIFEPFFTTKDVDKGTGLGLATVFGIVKEGGGAIAVDSEPGRGSTFQVFWPRVDFAAVPVVEPRRTPLHGRGTVLVVEDDHQLRALLERYLTGWGYTLLEAPSGVAALELIARHDGPIDLVLTDLVMPGGVDGRTLGRRVVAARPETRMIYMSGYTEHAALHAASIGADDDLLHKPFTAYALSEAVQRVLQRRDVDR